jgi:hypothetical protein
MADCFYCVESLEIFDIPGVEACLVRWNFKVVFVKNTMFKNTILDRSKKDTLNSFKTWLREAKNRKLITTDSAQLNHELEDANIPETIGKAQKVINVLIAVANSKAWNYLKSQQILKAALIFIAFMFFFSYISRIDSQLTQIEIIIRKK